MQARFAAMPITRPLSYILNLSAGPYKQWAQIAFRMDTPCMGLEAERGLVANLLVHIGDCQNKL